MGTVVQWTGREAALLGEAMRWSIREYAEKLGVDMTTVSRWRANGASTKLKPATAEMLDTLKGQIPPEALEVFYASLAMSNGEPAPALGPATITSHKFIPTYLGKTVDMIEGVSHPRGPGGLARRATAAEHPNAEPQSQLHLYECGVGVFHLVQRREVANLGDLATWRYRSYTSDLSWASQRLGDLLPSTDRAGVSPFSYVLSAYLLEDAPWEGPSLRAALQLLTTPSVLVDRQRPEAATRLGDDVERALLAGGFEHAHVHDFGSEAIALGFAGWSGVAYHPLAPERALPMDAIVALELDVQALWALSSYVLDEIEKGHDPVVPANFGWRFLRGVSSRLTAARPQETAQHQLMREAVLSTSQLPERLRTAQEALRESGI
ncbi:hypothetical protein [Streptomyces noursei]|uniref:hypothetical protein n=1 Tax=Streptomyces noursei TaxID=1971 RepID=UPI0038158B07